MLEERTVGVRMEHCAGCNAVASGSPCQETISWQFPPSFDKQMEHRLENQSHSNGLVSEDPGGDAAAAEHAHSAAGSAEDGGWGIARESCVP